MKKVLILIALTFLFVACNCLAQIKVSTEIIKGAKPYFCPTDYLELKLRFENVPYDNITGAAYEIHNFNLLGIRDWKKISNKIFEIEMLLEVKKPFVGDQAYIYIFSIGNERIISKEKRNVNKIAFVLENKPEVLDNITNKIPMKGVAKDK